MEEQNSPKLTDPVMPEDYSDTPVSPSPTPSFSPANSQPPKNPSLPPHKPATPPRSHSGKPPFLLLIILAIFAFSSTLIAAFLFVRSQTLSQQVATLQSIQDARQLSPTPTSTSNTSLSPTPQTTPSVTPPSTSPDSYSPGLSDIITLAQDDSPNAQLLMITSDNILDPDPVFNYWFRTAPDIKTYFFIKSSSNTPPQLMRPATVTPDNNIPDLIPDIQAGNVGLSANQALNLANQTLTDNNITSTPISVKAQYIKSLPSISQKGDQAANLWQLSYSFSDHPKVVIQINANSQQIVFDNLSQ